MLHVCKQRQTNHRTERKPVVRNKMRYIVGPNVQKKKPNRQPIALQAMDLGFVA
jgi:hypothetical protein